MTRRRLLRHSLSTAALLAPATAFHVLAEAGTPAAVPPLSNPGDAPAPWSKAEAHMGCLWTLTLPDTPPAVAEKAATAVFAEIHRLNQIFSDYETTSELNQLCAAAGQKNPLPVSRELFDILTKSRRMSELSRGAFDITLAPSVRLWRRSRRRGELPHADAIAKARALAGWEHIQLDAANQRALLTKPGMQLDLGGIAKGWTQDACLTLLREKFGITCLLLDAAGEVAVGTPPPGREHWRIGVQPTPGETPSRFALRETNIATSGDHYQFVEIDGRRYSHLIDPATGLGSIVSRQGTIIAPTGAEADPLTKFLCLMDSALSLPLIQKNFPGIHARVTESLPGEALKVHQTPGFPAAVS
ncbi:MAG: FAD:protein transferase [Verrucomicrobiales bacterium]|nr:FAD:protein transferase [Verrucomicrobiales bacterium]